MKYGDVYHQNEVEQSTYNFEHSDADFLFTAFNCAREAGQIPDGAAAGIARLRAGAEMPRTASTCWTPGVPSA